MAACQAAGEDVVHLAEQQLVALLQRRVGQAEQVEAGRLLALHQVLVVADAAAGQAQPGAELAGGDLGVAQLLVGVDVVRVDQAFLVPGGHQGQEVLECRLYRAILDDAAVVVVLPADAIGADGEVLRESVVHRGVAGAPGRGPGELVGLAVAVGVLGLEGDQHVVPFVNGGRGR